jgi:Holliday junction resolvase
MRPLSGTWQTAGADRQLASLELMIPLRPQPQGSLRAITVGNKAIMISDNRKLAAYRKALGTLARAALAHGQFDCIAKEVPIQICTKFFFRKPVSAKTRTWPMVRPDGDKLVRAVWDALTGVVFCDDQQVVSWSGGKFYGEPERAEIAVERI